MLTPKLLQYSAETFKQIKSVMLVLLQYFYSICVWEQEFTVDHS